MSNEQNKIQSTFIGSQIREDGLTCVYSDISHRGLVNASIFYDDQSVTGLRLNWSKNTDSDDTSDTEDLITLIGKEINETTGEAYSIESVTFSDEDLFFGFAGSTIIHTY